jgi:hypothetical protein
MAKGMANNRVVRVNLPRTLNANIDVVNVRNSCSPEQYEAERCPISVGRATAITPVLSEPLVGKVYLVRRGHRLPDMMVRLKGQGNASLINIDLDGTITIPRDLTLRTTFGDIPDVPITSFRLRFVSNRNAPVGTVNNLCVARYKKATVARLAFTAQSGKQVVRKQKMTVAGCGKRAKAGSNGKGRRGRKKANEKSTRRAGRHTARRR